MYFIVSLAKFGSCCSMVWARRQGQWKGKNYFLSEKAGKKLHIVLQCIFGLDFLSLCIMGIENHSSTSMPCCSDDLAQLLLSSNYTGKKML